MTPRPCPGCGAYMRQHGWTESTVPSGARLEDGHRGANCPNRRGTPSHADHLARGLEPIHCYLDADLARRVKAAAKESSLRDVLTSALESHLAGDTVVIPDGLVARCIAAGCSVDVSVLVAVAVAEFLTQPVGVVASKLTKTLDEQNATVCKKDLDCTDTTNATADKPLDSQALQTFFATL